MGFPLLGAAARSGELTERFAGILEAEDALGVLTVKSGAERFEGVGDDSESEDSPRMSTGTGVTGN